MDIVDATADHAAAIAAIYAPNVATTVSFETDPPDAVEFERRIGAHRPWLVAVDGGMVVGYAYASAFKDRAAYRHTAETTVYVHDGHRHRGVATALMEALLERLRLGGIRTVVAVIALPNPASVAAAERSGFRRAGTIPEAGFKHDRWIDVGFWVRHL